MLKEYIKNSGGEKHLVRLENLTRTTKRTILIAIDAVMILLAMLLSATFIQIFADITLTTFLFLFLLAYIFYLLFALNLKIFAILNRYTDYRVLFNLSVALSSAFLLTTLVAVFFLETFSYRFLLLSWLFSIPFLILPRLTWRICREYVGSTAANSSKPVKTLVVGAGRGSEIFVKTVHKQMSDIAIVGLVDDDPHKLDTYIHGVRVMGKLADIPDLVKEYEIEQVTIAIPSLIGESHEKLIDICRESGVKVNSMPSIEDTLLGKLSTKQLKEIDIADLLGRKEVVLDQSQLNQFFSDKTILVTGAGGSIGSEICRQVSKFKPKKLLLLGHGENSIYLIQRELLEKYSDSFEIVPLIADIQDRDLMFQLMKDYQPDVVYHAAAHKHVPLMEYNPREAVKNNIFGTKNVAEAAKAAGIERFVMISTDKAVNPPNVMGATKRVAEMIVTGLNEAGKTQFVAVRFGNVLGSRGSVVPVFKEQIAKGGPLTVTDFRMTRYFMTIPEASRLVIQAGYLAKGGEVFVLDMGEPVKIVDLAKKVIKLSGYTENDIKIVESGIRPGEKLYEELLSSDERVSEQIHEKIFIGKVTPKPLSVVEHFIAELPQLDLKTLKEKLIAFAKQE